MKGKTAVVLGAGSARGLAHIGVLQVLKENNIDFDFIVGSSMGAMVGSIYASGADLYMLARMADQMDTSVVMDVNIPRMGFVAGKKAKALLDLLTKHKSFAELDFPVYVVATDLISGQRVILDEGPVADAVRASISIPGVFHPVQKDDMVLVDGAVLDRLPVEVARMKGATTIIAVDVTFDPSKKVRIRNTLDVITTALDIMQKQQFDLIVPQADILIQPKVGNYGSREFDHCEEIVKLGRQAALEKIDEIKAKLEARS